MRNKLKIINCDWAHPFRKCSFNILSMQLRTLQQAMGYFWQLSSIFLQQALCKLIVKLLDSSISVLSRFATVEVISVLLSKISLSLDGTIVRNKEERVPITTVSWRTRFLIALSDISLFEVMYTELTWTIVKYLLSKSCAQRTISLFCLQLLSVLLYLYFIY